MRIRASTDFLHGRTRFTAAIAYEVPDRVGGYVVGNGWAAELPADDATPYITWLVDDLGVDAPRPPAEAVTIEVQDVTHTHDSPEA